MSLTADQREAVFEILNIPSFDQIGEMVDDNNICTFVLNYGDSAKRTSAYVDLMLNTIAASHPAKESLLTGYIADWEEIGTSPAKQEAGSVGNMSGMTDDPSIELKLIRGRVQRILAIRRWDEFIGTIRDEAQQKKVFSNIIAG